MPSLRALVPRPWLARADPRLERRRVPPDQGLTRSRPLAAPDVSIHIANRQRAAYETTPGRRSELAVGHELARSGALNELARAANRHLRPEATAARRNALDAGRVSQRTRRQLRADDAISDAGATDLAELLRTAYNNGGSLAELARLTGLGRARLRVALAEAGVAVRPIGANTTSGRWPRARSADAAAAAKVGTTDLVAWLQQRRREGVPTAELARAVGHSSQWVRWRIEP